MPIGAAIDVVSCGVDYAVSLDEAAIPSEAIGNTSATGVLLIEGLTVTDLSGVQAILGGTVDE